MGGAAHDDVDLVHHQHRLIIPPPLLLHHPISSIAEIISAARPSYPPLLAMADLTQPLVFPSVTKAPVSERRVSCRVVTIAVLTVALLISLGFVLLSAPLAPTPQAASPTLYVVFSNHLDLGYYNPHPLNTSSPFDYYSMLSTVQNALDQWIPNAVKYSAAMRSFNSTVNPHNDTYIWMTHSWVVQLFLHCPPNGLLRCPTPSQVEDAKAAIALGTITWHAFPFNSQHDVYSADLFDYGMQLGADLAKEFGRVGGPPNTISQRDVPGVTRAVIPYMRRRGVKAYSIGANSASAPAGVPTAFIWRDNATQTEVFGLYHRNGYGGIAPSDVHFISGWGSGLITNWAQDNQGPQPAESYLSDLATIRQEFPNYAVKVSTFDDFVNDLDVAYRAGVATLPVVTEEMGDTWVYGIASDPRKMQDLRLVQRARTRCLQTPSCDSTSASFFNFSFYLLKGGEHTWGGCVDCALAGADLSTYNSTSDYTQWTNEQFHARESSPAFSLLTQSFLEQRLWAIDYALEALPPSHPIRLDYQRETAQLRPRLPDLSEWAAIRPSDYHRRFKLLNVELSFDSTGAINHLSIPLPSGASTLELANDTHTLGAFHYQSYTHDDYIAFFNDYSDGQSWIQIDFGKLWLEKAGNFTRNDQLANLTALYFNASTASFLLEVTFPRPLHTEYGAPTQTWIVVQVHPATSLSLPSISWNVTYFFKTSTRIPEQLSMDFTPLPLITSPNSSVLHINKLGEATWIEGNANLTLVNGTSHLSGQWGGVMVGDRVLISSEDVPLVSYGRKQSTPFVNPMPQHDAINTTLVSFSIFNNVSASSHALEHVASAPMTALPVRSPSAIALSVLCGVSA